ncbi:hypothetical protein X777_08699, partial [Ooceraea biroi]
DYTWTCGIKTFVVRGTVTAALCRDVEIQYRESEHTYRLGELGTMFYNTAQKYSFLGVRSTLPVVRQDFVTGVKGGRARAEGAACCPHQAPLRIFHREFTSLDTTGKLQEWRSNLSLLASMGSLFFSQVPFPERPSSCTYYTNHKVVGMRVIQPSYRAIITRKIAMAIHPTCFIVIFHPRLSSCRNE